MVLPPGKVVEFVTTLSEEEKGPYVQDDGESLGRTAAVWLAHKVAGVNEENPCCQASLKMRTGVICETWALPGAVIPAKAGIYSARHWKCAAGGVDSRFRGNDQCPERNSISNDTTTRILPPLTPFERVCYHERLTPRGNFYEGGCAHFDCRRSGECGASCQEDWL